jgi:ribosomal protein S18 acetylase RimI-like enzyme
MLSVHEHLQSLGLGTRLIAALEKRVRKRGLDRVQLGVEHDNPRALALYRGLGYREVGSRVESWPVAGGRSYVTVSTVLERVLHPT